MNSKRLLGLSLLLATAMSAVGAQGLTRDEVAADTRAAQAAGAIPHGDLDISSANRGADIHPALSASAGLTRAAVKAELAQAVAAGQVTVGDDDRTLAQINPSHYPQAQAVQTAHTVTRAQVRAELARAERDGDVQNGDDGRTLAEITPQRYAAARASDEPAHVASN